MRNKHKLYKRCNLKRQPIIFLTELDFSIDHTWPGRSVLGDGEAGPPGEAHDPPLEGCPLGESLQRLEGRILRPDVQEVAFVDVKPLRRRSDRSIHVTLLIKNFCWMLSNKEKVKRVRAM